MAGDSNCPQGLFLSPQPPRSRRKPCRLIESSSQLVGIQQVRTARFGILGSPPSRIACVGDALTLRPEGGARQVHTRNENHGLVPPTLHPSNRRVSLKKKLLDLSNPSHNLSYLHRHDARDRLLSEGDGELVRAIARTISETFWIPQREPRAHDRYNLREIAKDMRASRKSGSSRICALLHTRALICR